MQFRLSAQVYILGTHPSAILSATISAADIATPPLQLKPRPQTAGTSYKVLALDAGTFPKVVLRPSTAHVRTHVPPRMAWVAWHHCPPNSISPKSLQDPKIHFTDPTVPREHFHGSDLRVCAGTHYLTFLLPLRPPSLRRPFLVSSTTKLTVHFYSNIIWTCLSDMPGSPGSS